MSSFGRASFALYHAVLRLSRRAQLYNQAWLFAAQHPVSPSGTDDKTSAALTELIDNWTNAEFADFVAKCEAAVDALELREGTPEWSRAEEVRARSRLSRACARVKS